MRMRGCFSKSREDPSEFHPHHCKLPKDCSEVKDPQNSTKDKVLHTKKFQGCHLCILGVPEVPTILCTHCLASLANLFIDAMTQTGT